MTRHLKCILTEEELKKAGEEMAKAYTDLESEQDGLKAAQAQFKARIAALEAQIGLSANKIQNGYEFRQVECENREFGLSIETYRIDTGEVIEIRPMTKDEKQRKFNFEQEQAQQGGTVVEAEFYIEHKPGEAGGM